MITINPNKRIGQFVYIVEGAKKEFTLITQIFKKLFGFDIIQYNRDSGLSLKYYHKKTDSVVYIVNSETSSINSIKSGQEYLDNIFKELYFDYGLDLHNCATFYIFDRDYKSNTNIDLIYSMFDTLKNSRDNGFEQGGLLLLNYPSIESFVVSCFENPLIKDKSSNAEDLKTYINDKKYQQNLINYEHLINATKITIEILLNKLNEEFNTSDLDSFGSKNKNIFNKQEIAQTNNGEYCLLGLFCLSLIDLDLIHIENNLEFKS